MLSAQRFYRNDRKESAIVTYDDESPDLPDRPLVGEASTPEWTKMVSLAVQEGSRPLQSLLLNCAHSFLSQPFLVFSAKCTFIF